MENIINQFCEIKAEDVNEDMREKLYSLLVELLDGCKSYTTHWEIRISSVNSFLDEMKIFLKETKSVFVDIETLHIVAKVIVDIYVSREKHYEKAARFMDSLGFLEDAWELYEKEIHKTPWNLDQGRKALLHEKKRLLVKKQQEEKKLSSKFEEIVNSEVKRVVDSAKNKAIWEIFNPKEYISWSQWYAQGEKHLPWDHSIDEAHKALREMGYTKEERLVFFKPAYKKIVESLKKDRDNKAKSGDTWWINQITKYEKLLL